MHWVTRRVVTPGPSLEDTIHHLHKEDAFLNLKMHLATATPHTGFINIADTPHQELLARKWKVPRDSRAVSFHTNKHIPPNLDKNFLDASKKAKRETAHYCFKFRRYICTGTCRGIAVANRRQMLLSRKRISALSVAEYVHLRVGSGR